MTGAAVGSGEAVTSGVGVASDTGAIDAEGDASASSGVLPLFLLMVAVMVMVRLESCSDPPTSSMVKSSGVRLASSINSAVVRFSWALAQLGCTRLTISFTLLPSHRVIKVSRRCWAWEAPMPSGVGVGSAGAGVSSGIAPIKDGSSEGAALT